MMAGWPSGCGRPPSALGVLFEEAHQRAADHGAVGDRLGGRDLLGRAGRHDAAAVRATFPQANPSIYLTSSLGITLPFNLLVGLPMLVAGALLHDVGKIREMTYLRSFDYTDEGVHKLKGFDRPLHAWRVLRSSTVRPR